MTTTDYYFDDRLPHWDIDIAYRIPGWMWPVELGWVSDRFSSSNVHIEVGVYCGKSLYASAMQMSPGSKLIAVDPHHPDGFSSLQVAKWVSSVFEATCELIRSNGIEVEHWKMTSIDAARRAYEENLIADSIFIDANHHYAECKADIEAWRPFIKPGGIISGHDYWAVDPGVMEAVNEAFAESTFEVASNTRIWWSTLPQVDSDSTP